MNSEGAATKLTVAYLDAIRSHLHIETSPLLQPVFVPGRVTRSDLVGLGQSLRRLLADAQPATDEVRRSVGAQLQSVPYGIVDDLDMAIRVGYLLGDRVVVWDLLAAQLLSEATPREDTLESIGLIANSLLSANKLAKQGHLVILPHPLSWHSDAKSAREELLRNGVWDPAILGLATATAVARDLPLQPYAIQGPGDFAKVAAAVKGVPAASQFSSIWAGALAGSLLANARFERALRVPLSDFHDVVESRENFYAKFRQRLEESRRMPVPAIDSLAKELGEGIERDNRAEVLWEWQTVATGVAGIVAVGGGAPDLGRMAIAAAPSAVALWRANLPLTQISGGSG